MDEERISSTPVSHFAAFHQAIAEHADLEITRAEAWLKAEVVSLLLSFALPFIQLDKYPPKLRNIDLWERIIGFTDPKTAITCAQVSHFFTRICYSDIIWRKFVLSSPFARTSPFLEEHVPWKLKYRIFDGKVLHLSLGYEIRSGFLLNDYTPIIVGFSGASIFKIDVAHPAELAPIQKLSAHGLQEILRNYRDVTQLFDIREHYLRQETGMFGSAKYKVNLAPKNKA